MEFKQESNRIYMEDREGKVIAEVTFPPIKKDVVNINHTYVDDSLRGQGIAGQLLQATANKLKEENKKAILSCSYAISWFEKNKQYQDLISH